MTTIQVPDTAFYVRWSCRRCRHHGGFAQTTVPLVTKDWTEDMLRHLFDDLRLHLVKRHLQGQGCVAVPDDFVLERGVPEDRQLSGLI